MNGKPILNNFLKVAGTFELTAGATVQSLPTILIHIKLNSIPYISHFTETRKGLIEFYHNTNQLHIMEMPFNITNSRAAGKWNNEVAIWIVNLSGYMHVIIFATTHSVPDNGDLWLGGIEPRKPIATTVANVIIYLFIYLFFCHIIQILTVNSTVAGQHHSALHVHHHPQQF
jgi:hypothetical protein